MKLRAAIIIIVIAGLVVALFLFGFIGNFGGHVDLFKRHFKKNKHGLSHLQRQQKIREIIHDVLEAAYQNDVEIWAEFGTLLGLVREGDVICYDRDADFCLLSRDWKKFKKALRGLTRKNKNYAHIYFDFPPFIQGALVFDKRTGISLDVWALRKIKAGGGLAVVSGVLSPLWEKPIAADDIFPLQKVNFPKLKSKIFLPRNPPALLRSWYGDDYRNPDFTCDSNCEQCKKS